MHQLIQQIKRHKGFKSYPEYCPAGKLSIGYGRDLDGVGIRLEEAEILLANDLNALLGETRENINLEHCNPARLAALINLIHLLGLECFLTFNRVITAIESRDFVLATNELLLCLKAKYLPQYTAQLLLQLESGQWQ
ncbi:glycoside hydrolase [Thalassomonas sp. RHCl1]|uniref:glycoside hydrolase family protein n=1 Tax=Thalassomonas sp. RHCl1 TaxID=2995320 RepID=UPI00248B0669|nr:glycoside hydrolase [Thalassomonas sp. RHCl1]